MLTMQVIGNVGQDPEVRTTERGVKLARFSLASNKKVKGEKITTWVNVTVFDEKKIEFISSFVKKGSKLFIEGEPQARGYESNGQASASLDCVLSYGSKIEICSSEGGSSASSSPAQTQGSAAPAPVPAGGWDDLDDDLDDVPY